jgi:tetratricopeptide (TPR) repeat protein
LLFALHPLQVEPVAWVTGMKDLLAGLLSLIALWQYLLHVRHGAQTAKTKSPAQSRRDEKPARPGAHFHYAAATIALVLALLAKPVAVAVPLMAWIFDYFYFQRSWPQMVKSLGAWLILAVLFIGLTRWAQPESQQGIVTAVWQRPMIALDALAFYLYKLALPLDLSVDYGRTPAEVMQRGWSYFTWIVPAGLGWWIWRGRASRLLTAAAVFVVGLSPVLGLLPFGFQQISTVADRYLYLAMLGPALALAWGVSTYPKPWLWVGCATILALLSVRTVTQLTHWKNNDSLFHHALNLNSKSWMAQLNLGYSDAERGRLDEAITRYRAALSLRPGYGHALNNLGNALLTQGKFVQAVEQYHEALRNEPDAADIHFNLAKALAKLNRLDEAVDHFNKSSQLEPDNASTHVALAQVLYRQRQLDSATDHYHTALRLDPRSADAHYGLADIFHSEGRLDEALQEYLQAVREKPSYAAAYLNIGVIFANRGQWATAIDNFQQALRVQPDFAEAREMLARASALRGTRESGSTPK